MRGHDKDSMGRHGQISCDGHIWILIKFDSSHSVSFDSSHCGVDGEAAMEEGQCGSAADLSVTMGRDRYAVEWSMNPTPIPPPSLVELK